MKIKKIKAFFNLRVKSNNEQSAHFVLFKRKGFFAPKSLLKEGFACIAPFFKLLFFEK